MPVGYQDPWVVGNRGYFRRDAVGGVVQPWCSFGVMRPASPAMEPDVAQLFDSGEGRLELFDETVTKIVEGYEFEVQNLSLRVRAYLFLANPPEAFTQVAEEKIVTHTVHLGELLKITDSDTAKTSIFTLAAIGGVYTGTVTTNVLKAITKASKTFKFTGNVAAAGGLAAGKAFVVHKVGLANIANSRSYTVVSATFNTPDTDVVVNEDPAADEVAITGQTTYANAGTVFIQDVDWRVDTLDRGFIKIMPGGAITNLSTPSVVYSKAALTGLRIIKPQTAGQIRGDLILVWTRNRNTDQDARECRVSITPGGANFDDAAYSSATLSVKVLSTVGDIVPAGRLLHFKGIIPDAA